MLIFQYSNDHKVHTGSEGGKRVKVMKINTITKTVIIK